jgi:DNA-binding response OmpR family regulator
MFENRSRAGEILLVEDDENDAEHLTRVLNQVGIQNPIRWLKDGASGMSYLAEIQHGENAPAILLLDIKLPVFSGFDILKALRGVSFFNRMLKIAFSTLDDAATIKQTYVLGADSFLIKPVQVDDLNNVIESFPGPWLLEAEKPDGS